MACCSMKWILLNALLTVSILPITYPAVLRQQVFSFDVRGAEGGSSSSASSSASASPPLSADHQGAQHTVTRGLTVGGNIQKYPALVRSRGMPSHDYTNTYSNTTAYQNSSNSNSNSNIHNRRWENSISFPFVSFSVPTALLCSAPSWGGGRRRGSKTNRMWMGRPMRLSKRRSPEQFTLHSCFLVITVKGSDLWDQHTQHITSDCYSNKGAVAAHYSAANTALNHRLAPTSLSVMYFLRIS